MSTLEMLSPKNFAIAFIDYQPAMYQGVQSHDRLVIFNNIQILAKAAKLFDIPTVISTVAKDSFSGPFMPEVTDPFPEHHIIDRTAMNDRARAATYNGVMEILKAHSPYGIQVRFSKWALGEHASEAG